MNINKLALAATTLPAHPSNLLVSQVIQDLRATPSRDLDLADWASRLGRAYALAPASHRGWWVRTWDTVASTAPVDLSADAAYEAANMASLLAADNH